MVKLTVNIEEPTRADLADQLDRIAFLLREGYTSGIGPNWDSVGEDEAVGEETDTDE